MTDNPGESSVRPRFHLDEQISPEIARALTAKGIDVTSSQSVGLLQAGDDVQFRFSQRAGRVFVTCDKDFLVTASLIFDHCGIVFFPGEPRSIGEIIDALLVVAECATASELRGRVEFM